MTFPELFLSAVILGAWIGLCVLAEFHARERERRKRARQDIVRANPINPLDLRA